MHDDPRPEPPHRRFEGLVRDYSRLIRGVVRRVAGADADRVADDAEQEILLALWRQVRQDRVIAAPVSYVYRAAVRETVRLVRAVHADRTRRLEAARAVPSAAADPLTLLEGVRAEQRLRDALDRLPEDRRRAVEAHLAGMSAEEIGAVTGWSYNRTRNLVGKGMADLRRSLRQQAD
jgi:RNA polymerase sigma factor (sigma-70 family)